MEGLAGTLAELVPFKLFLTLGGVGILFSLASVNGTMAAVTGRLLSKVSQRRAAVPLVLFLTTALIAGFGVGNIAATALVAPAALALAPRLGLSPLLTTLLVIGGANAGTLSPLSMTGILARELLAGLPFNEAERAALGWRMFGRTFAAVTLVHTLGFLALGGLSWLVGRRLAPSAVPVEHTLMSKRLQSKPFDQAQRRTLAAVGGFAFLLVVSSLPPIRSRLVGAGIALLAEPGVLASFAAAACLVLRTAPLAAAARAMPWKTIGLICSMFFAASVVERAGGMKFAAHALESVGRGPLLPVWAAMVAGIFSTFSSSSGVVMPFMLPLVAALGLDSSAASDLATSIVLGAHLVDCSPLSSLGALCIGAAPDLDAKERRKLFRSLLVWGLAMAPCAGLVAALFV